MKTNINLLSWWYCTHTLLKHSQLFTVYELYIFMWFQCDSIADWNKWLYSLCHIIEWKIHFVIVCLVGKLRKYTRSYTENLSTKFKLRLVNHNTLMYNLNWCVEYVNHHIVRILSDLSWLVQSILGLSQK